MGNNFKWSIHHLLGRGGLLARSLTQDSMNSTMLGFRLAFTLLKPDGAGEGGLYLPLRHAPYEAEKGQRESLSRAPR